MLAVDVLQGTPEWLEARRGRVTASRISDVLAKRKDGTESDLRKHYRMELVAERLTSLTTPHFFSDDMAWGIETEPSARGAYEMRFGLMTDIVGLVMHPKIEWAAASPDGLVKDTGLLEIKCPRTVTHLEYIEAGTIPARYAAQMMWQMSCTGREWCDFVSFDPRINDHDLKLYVKRLQRDDKLIAGMECEVVQFLQEVDAAVETIRSKQRDERSQR